MLILLSTNPPMYASFLSFKFMALFSINCCYRHTWIPRNIESKIKYMFVKGVV